MIIKQRLSLTIILVLSCLLALTAQVPDEEPTILGDDKLFDGRYFNVRGHAELFWMGYHIVADEVNYDTQERIVRVKGRVSINQKESVISGDEFELNLKTAKGVMKNVFGMAPPTVSFKTDRLDQVDHETLRFNRFELSSCGQTKPDWSIKASKGLVKKDRYIEMKDVVFKINILGGIPVLYLPYLRYPLHKDGRSTGFLFPLIGNSQQRGYFVRNAFFWDIASNFDITVKFDWFEKVGIGLGTDVRYLFHGGTHGEGTYYHFFHKADSVIKQGDTNQDYQVAFFHDQRISFLNTRLSFNVNQESNPMIRQLFNDSFALSLYSNFESRIRSETQILSNLIFSAGASKNKTFYNSEKTSTTLTYFPTFSLSLTQQELGFIPGRLSAMVTAEKVTREGVGVNLEHILYDTDVEVQRLFITPAYTLSVFDKPWLSLSVDLTSQYSIYDRQKNPDYDSQKDPISKRIVETPLTLVSKAAKVQLQGFKFERIYEGKRSRIQHLIYPEVSLNYTSKYDEEQQNLIVKVDSSDYSPFGYVSFSLHNRIRKKGRDIAQEGSATRDYMSWSVAIDYFLDPQEAHYGRTIDGVYPVWSPVRTQFSFSPNPYMTFSSAFDYELTRKMLTRSYLSLTISNVDRSINGDLSFSQYENVYVEKDPFKSLSIGSSLRINPSHWPLGFDGTIHYNLTQNLIYAMAKINIKMQCWSIGLGVQQKLVFIANEFKPDFQFQFGVQLGQMGMVQDLLSLGR